MTQAPYPPPARPYAPPIPRSNGLGIAGFIVSMVGLVICGGVLCPIGALLSLPAVFSRPRGLAVAGLVIGVVGTLLWGGAWFMIFYKLPNLMPNFNMMRAEQDINNHYWVNNAMPDDATGQQLVGAYTDDWGTAFDYHKVDAQHYEIISAGQDTQFGTPDDIATPFASAGLFGSGTWGNGAMGLPTDQAIANAHREIEDTFEGDYQSPGWSEVQQLLGQNFFDEWNMPLRYNEGDGLNYELHSAGPDMVMGTADDVVHAYTLGDESDEPAASDDAVDGSGAE